MENGASSFSVLISNHIVDLGYIYNAKILPPQYYFDKNGVKKEGISDWL